MHRAESDSSPGVGREDAGSEPRPAACASSRAWPSRVQSAGDRLTGVVVARRHAARTCQPDHVFAFFGLHPKLTGRGWGYCFAFEKKGAEGRHREQFQTSVPGIFAVGDINTYRAKKKLILSACPNSRRVGRVRHPGAISIRRRSSSLAVHHHQPGDRRSACSASPRRPDAGALRRVDQKRPPTRCSGSPRSSALEVIPFRGESRVWHITGFSSRRCSLAQALMAAILTIERRPCRCTRCTPAPLRRRRLHATDRVPGRRP